MPTASPSLLHSLLSALCLLSFAFPLHAQTQPLPPKFKAAGITTAEQLQQEIRAAKRPKSDKWSLSLPPVDFKKYQQIGYIVVTELTDAGRALPLPDVYKPVYYTYGGTHDNEYKFLPKDLTVALASNGYLPSDADHPPTQVLFFTSGMHRRMEATGNADNGGDVSVNSNDIIDLLSRARTVGGEKFADEFARALAGQLEWSGTSDSSQNSSLRRFAERDDAARYNDTKAVVQALFHDWYYLLVYSLDYEAFRNNQKKTLWTTHISTPARGTSLEATLPSMGYYGSYYFGRKTDGPEILKRPTGTSPSIQIGKVEVVEYTSGSIFSSGTVGQSPKIIEIEAGERKSDAAAPDAAAPAARIYALVDVDQKPVLKEKSKSAYVVEYMPPDTRERSADITFVVETDGTVGDIKIIRATPNGYGAGCVNDVAQWKYSPAMLNGQPVRCRMTAHFDKTHPQGSEPSSANQSTENPETQRRPADTRPSIQISVPEAEVVEYISGTTSPSGTVAPAASGTCATHPETFDKK